MRGTPTPIKSDLVLIGGGHAHAIVLKMWRMNPLPGVRVTLVSDVSLTPYSGMLPGLISGEYTLEDSHIDLRALCHLASARFILASATGLDLGRQIVKVSAHPELHYDLLSIDCGSRSRLNEIKGAEDFGVPIKPVPDFLASWTNELQRINQENQRSNITVVGGGAGGVELALAIRARLNKELKGSSPERVTVSLVNKEPVLLPTHSQAAQRKMTKVVSSSSIVLHLGSAAKELSKSQVTLATGEKISSDFTILSTQPTAPTWPAESGLAVDSEGFIRVNEFLQSVSHPNVFAAGDIASLDSPRPKAGVFAVRQGAPLFRNLRAKLQGGNLAAYNPQRNFLSLIGSGSGSALYSRGELALYSRFFWIAKKLIDRRFMNGFANLTPTANNIDNEPPMRCFGCGAKLGRDSLKATLAKLNLPSSTDKLSSADDATIITPPPGKVLVQSVDFFPPLVTDEYLSGMIAANHALNDIYAMGAFPHSALALVTLPQSNPTQEKELLFNFLSGALAVFRKDEVALLGGHTIAGENPCYGFSCNGFLDPEQLLSKSRVNPDQSLILTKGLGVGVIFAALMHGAQVGSQVDAAISSMLLSNREALRILLAHQVAAATDITGFGLLGHLAELLEQSKLGAEILLDSLPLIPGASELSAQGFSSSLYPENRKLELSITTKLSSDKRIPLLFDPQTSGGLLAAVPKTQAEPCLKALISAGYNSARIVGRTISEQILKAS